MKTNKQQTQVISEYQVKSISVYLALKDMDKKQSINYINAQLDKVLLQLEGVIN